MIMIEFTLLLLKTLLFLFCLGLSLTFFVFICIKTYKLYDKLIKSRQKLYEIQLSIIDESLHMIDILSSNYCYSGLCSIITHSIITLGMSNVKIYFNFSGIVNIRKTFPKLYKICLKCGANIDNLYWWDKRNMDIRKYILEEYKRYLLKKLS